MDYKADSGRGYGRMPGKKRGLWDNGKPKKWYYALPIVLFWIVVLVLIIKGLIFR